MSKTRTKSKLNLTARSETRKGFTMPAIKKIKAVLRNRSKSFIIALFISAFSKLTKTDKIRMLLKIERKSPSRRTRKSKSRRKTKRRSTRRKTKRKSSKRKSSRRRGKLRKGSPAAKAAMKKARAGRK